MSAIVRSRAHRSPARGQLPVRVTVVGHQIGTDPFAEWLQHTARTYAVLDGRDWPNNRVDERVSRADHAALRFAYTLLDTTTRPTRTVSPRTTWSR